MVDFYSPILMLFRLRSDSLTYFKETCFLLNSAIWFEYKLCVHACSHFSSTCNFCSGVQYVKRKWRSGTFYLLMCGILHMQFLIENEYRHCCFSSRCEAIIVSYDIRPILRNYFLTNIGSHCRVVWWCGKDLLARMRYNTRNISRTEEELNAVK